MDGAVLWPGARNEKAPARFLSGRTSAMIELCVKGGRFVNAFFTSLSTPCMRRSLLMPASNTQRELDCSFRRMQPLNPAGLSGGTKV